MPLGSTRPSCAQALAFTLLILGGCHQEGPSEARHLPDEPPPIAEETSSSPNQETQSEALTEASDAEDSPGDPKRPLEPIDILRATSTYTVFTFASKGSPLRGRIPRGNDFHIFARQDDPECNAGWVQVVDGWICNNRTELGRGAPVTLPRIPEGRDVPFVYARHRSHRDTATPPIEVFRSLRALNRKVDPIGTLSPYGSHAFARHVRNQGKPALLTSSGRAISSKDMTRFRPSRFHGRNLEREPIPAGKLLSWTPYDDTAVFAEPDTRSAKISTLPRHSELLVIQLDGDEDWVKLDDSPKGGLSGFISTSALRSFIPTPPDRTNSDELTIDVELDQQMLSLWRGTTPIFATLISSGKAGDRTPLGLYSIGTKWALSKMENREGDDPYFVDAVPWVMYFSGRYALHASYWHNRFGQRLSHGCINLSPRDARRVFELTSPTLPPGWLLVHALERDPGTTIRIRRGDRPVPDRRGENSPSIKER